MVLILSMLVKISSREYLEIFLFFPGNWTFYAKCQILFSGKNKKNNINLSSAEFAQRVVMETICIKCQIPFSGKNKKNINL